MESCYPFDFHLYNNDVKITLGRIYISKKLAKALIVKFLKRENIFVEVMEECLLANPNLKNVCDVLENMTKGNQFMLKDCLISSDRIFTWSNARKHHIGDRDFFWYRTFLGKWRPEDIGSKIIVVDEINLK